MKSKVTIVTIILIVFLVCWIHNTNKVTREDIDDGCLVCKVNAMNEKSNSIFVICLYDGDVISVDGNDKTTGCNNRSSKDLEPTTFIKHSCEKTKYIVKYNSSNTVIDINVIKASNIATRELKICNECKKEIRKKSGRITNPIVLPSGLIR